MISRRDFLNLALGMGSVGALGGCAGIRKALGEAAPKRLRTITYNVYACKGWSRAKYEAGGMDKPAPREHLQKMAGEFAAALRPFDPDIVTFQEGPQEWVVRAIGDALALPNLVYFPSGGNWPGAVLTRYRVVSSQNGPLVEGTRPKDLFTRHWGKAVLETPAGALLLHSAHLHPSDSAIREREVTEILKAIERDRAAGGPLILQGDLNHPPTSPEYPRWKGAGLVDTFEAAGMGAEPTIPADAPKGRIDFVWALPPFAARAQEVRVLNEPPFRPEKPDPASLSLSDHMPVMATFRL